MHIDDYIGPMILVIIVLLVCGSLVYVGYQDSKREHKCEAAKGLYYNSVCYEITGRVIR